MSAAAEPSTMLTLSLSDFLVEIKDGSIKNAGAPTKSAEAKLYDVEHAEAREFGDERVKLAFEDGEGNVVHVALDAPEARAVARGIESLEEESRVFE